MNQAPLTTKNPETILDPGSGLELKIGVGLIIICLLAILINFFE